MRLLMYKILYFRVILLIKDQPYLLVQEKLIEAMWKVDSLYRIVEKVLLL